MATLQGQTIAGSYKDLLQVSNSNSGVDATARAVEDGEGTATLLYLSTTEVYSPGKAGTSNTVFGKAGGAAVAAGATYNVIIGEEAAHDLETGDDNVFIGYRAGDKTVDVDRAVMIGSNAGGDNMTAAGDGNIGIGFQAMTASTTGQFNIAIGYNSLVSNVAGDKLVAIGYQAAEDYNPTADYGNSVFIGYQAGLNTTTARKATVVGDLACGLGIMTGHENTVIGHAAGMDLVGGDSNVMVGVEAGANTQAGTNMTIVGRKAASQANITSGSAGHVCLGYEASYNLESGAGNTALGYRTLKTNVDGDFNTAVGHQALETFEADADGHGANTAVGYNAGNAISTGTENICIGSTSGATGTNNLTTGDNNVLIGAATAVSASGADNQIVIGTSVTGVANHSVTLGNANVTAVYMAQDSGAVVYCTGVNFPDDASTGVGDVNTLDAYEEGSFTATLVGSSGNPGTKLTATVANYTKIGRNVTIAIAFENINTASYSGNITITGLPFNCLANRALFSCALYNMATFASDAVWGVVTASSSTIELQYMRSEDTWASVTHNASSSSYAWIMGTYIA